MLNIDKALGQFADQGWSDSTEARLLRDFLESLGERVTQQELVDYLQSRSVPVETLNIVLKYDRCPGCDSSFHRNDSVHVQYSDGITWNAGKLAGNDPTLIDSDNSEHDTPIELEDRNAEITCSHCGHKIDCEFQDADEDT